jgi:hypothetical protein
MSKYATLLPTLLVGLTLSLVACKKQDAHTALSTPTPTPTVAAATAPTAVPAPAPVVLPAPAAPAAGKFDVNSVPLVTKSLPPFPYLGWPDALAKDPPREEVSDFDRVYVVAGTELRAVEGRINKRHFDLSSANLSRLAAERNYDAAMKEMGATLVNKVEPSNPAFREANKDLKPDADKLGILDTDARYSSYLLRTPETNTWIVISIGDGYVSLVAAEEKQMVRSVKPIAAAAL